MDAAPVEKLECFFENGEVETLFAQSCEFPVNCKLANLSLSFRAQQLEDDLFVKAPDQFGSENAV